MQNIQFNSLGFQQYSSLTVSFYLNDMLESNCCYLDIGSIHYHSCSILSLSPGFTKFSILLSKKAISKPFIFQHIHLIIIISNADKKSALTDKKFNLTSKERNCQNTLLDCSEYSATAVLFQDFGKGFTKQFSIQSVSNLI